MGCSGSKEATTGAVAVASGGGGASSSHHQSTSNKPTSQDPGKYSTVLHVIAYYRSVATYATCGRRVFS
jgi:hypothetical protein